MAEEDNRLLGACPHSQDDQTETDLEQIYRFFLILKQKHRQAAETFCGGQQQMLVLIWKLLAGPPAAGMPQSSYREILTACLDNSFQINNGSSLNGPTTAFAAW